jgi:hypothetical protein
MENERKATPRQLAYIRQLMKRKGEEDIELDESLNFQEASKIIEDLLGIFPRNSKVQSAKINEPRLGMAMKECYKMWRNCGRDVFDEHRERFKEDVIRTYQLFADIAQELEQSSQMEA